MKNQELVNVAPSSDNGHFVKGARKVVELDSLTEAFYVEGKSELVTKNHTDLKLNSDCLIISQVAFNPFSKMYEKVVD